MASLLTPAEIRKHIETDLEDVPLQRLLDDADRDIVAKYGPHTGNITELVVGEGNLLFLSQVPSAIVSVTETRDDADQLLGATDYRTWYGRVLERIATGAFAATTWGERVVVVYTPVDDQARRKRIEIDLVRLAIEYDAQKSSSDGDHSESDVDYEDERQRILGSLSLLAMA